MQQNQRTILIIDDCLEDRETYRRYLLQDSSYAYTILEEEYGENGLELCTKVKPDAILLDCFLPDINGLQFLSELKKKNQTDENQIPVVILTSPEQEAIAAAAIKSGAQEYLVKGGMTPKRLRLAINNALERQRQQETLRQSEENYRLLAEATPQLVWTAQPGGSIEYCNRYWYDYIGLTAVQTLGSGWGLSDSVQIQVSDTGQGISAEFLPYVFDLFRQGTRTGKQGGLGLGLAIASHLIKLQGGTIKADSPGEGQGATFTIELPLVDDDC